MCDETHKVYNHLFQILIKVCLRKFLRYDMTYQTYNHMCNVIKDLWDFITVYWFVSEYSEWKSIFYCTVKVIINKMTFWTLSFTFKNKILKILVSGTF